MDVESASQYILNRLDSDLSHDLSYHGAHHTRDVFQATVVIAKYLGVGGEQLDLLRTAALYHDCGFLLQYRNHEEAGCELVRDVLPQFGYDARQIERLCGMIMATKIPQRPQNSLEQILCDADLDYLGRSDFKAIGHTLFEEMKRYGMLESEEEWNRIQLGFLQNHRYFTSFGLKWREPAKQEHLKSLEAIVMRYESTS